MMVQLATCLLVLLMGCAPDPEPNAEPEPSLEPGPDADPFEPPTWTDFGELEGEARAQAAFDFVADGLDDATLATSEAAVVWSGTSAPHVLWWFLPAAIAENWEDATDEELQAVGCPTLNRTDRGLEVIGNGCTDEEGGVWHGSLRPSPDVDGQTVVRGFGWQTDPIPGCDGRTSYQIFDGVFSQANNQTDLLLAVQHLEFNGDCTILEDRDLAFEGWVRSTTSTEQADVEGQSTEIEVTTYSHQGVVAVDSDRVSGIVTAQTVDERLSDELCETEALSGTTTVTAGADVMVITSDGDVDCDEQSTVTWMLNGENQGTLVGVSCSSAGASTGLWLVGLLVALARRRE